MKITVLAAQDKLVAPKEYILTVDIKGELLITTVKIIENDGVRGVEFEDGFGLKLRECENDVVKQFISDILSWY